MEFKKKWDNTLHRLEEYQFGKTSLYDILIKVALFLLLLVVVPYLFSTDKTSKLTDMKIGSISTKKVVAPFNFYILKTTEVLEKERAESINRVPFYFIHNDSITENQLYKLNEILPYLIKNKQDISIDDSGEVENKERILEITDELKLFYDFNISVANLCVIYDILNDQRRISHLESVIDITKRYMEQGILSLELLSITRPNVTVIRNGVEVSVPKEKRLDLPALKQIIDDKLSESFNANQISILKYFFNHILQPNLTYDRKFTDRAVNNAINSVSLTIDMVYENERIVDANERIDGEIYQKLYSLEAAKVERSRREGKWQDNISFLGKMMLLASILFILGLYLYSFRRKIFADNKKLFLIVFILLGQLIFAAIVTGPLNWHAYLIPTTISSMLLAILIDAGIGFVGTVVIALILGGIQGGGYDITLITLIAGMVAIYSVHRIRTRNQVFKAIVYISFAYFWVIIALTALRYDSLIEAVKFYSFNLLPNAIFSPFITFMVLGIFERFFDITTDVTLLELSDLNRPLLKKLSLQAPGTFHHSLVVGNLAEVAAKAIDANSLLARVGSYYHDIGKMEKPEYFVENQMDAENRHNALAPSMSALILASHVKNGIELAKKYNIPELIRDFIPEHHGTNIMTYFYNKALEMSEANDVNEADFRYPGPKPQSKETGIVMLADAVEAATRTISNPTPNKVRSFVDTLVDKRFKDGELDDCDLTLRDLKKIVDAFMPVLFGVFQHRIEYPDTDKKKVTTKPRQKAEKVLKNENPNSPAKS